MTTTLNDLQAIVDKCPCDDPGCSITQHGPERKGFRMRYKEGVFYLACAACGEHSEDLALSSAERSAFDETLKNATHGAAPAAFTITGGCHPGAGVRLHYYKHQRTLEIACAVCDTGLLFIRNRPDKDPKELN